MPRIVDKDFDGPAGITTRFPPIAHVTSMTIYRLGENGVNDNGVSALSISLERRKWIWGEVSIIFHSKTVGRLFLERNLFLDRGI